MSGNNGPPDFQRVQPRHNGRREIGDSGARRTRRLAVPRQVDGQHATVGHSAQFGRPVQVHAARAVNQNQRRQAASFRLDEMHLLNSVLGQPALGRDGRLTPLPGGGHGLFENRVLHLSGGKHAGHGRLHKLVGDQEFLAVHCQLAFK